MATDVLKEFLVAISYKIDASSERKFLSSIDSATKSLAKMSLGIEAALLSINAYALRVATNFDQIYYASGRVGASVTNMKALAYGLSQMGSSADAANASMENFARTIRNNPGYNSVLERLGIRTKDASGMQRDATKLMEDFGKALRSKPQHQQAMYLDMFGIDERTGRALIQGVERFADGYREKLKKAGLDPDKAARDGNALKQAMTSVGSSIDIIGAKIASRLFDDQGNAFKRFLDFLDQHGDKIADTVSKLALVALQLAEAFLKLATSDQAKKALDALLGTIGKLDEQTGKFEADLDKLTIAMGVFAGFVATTWVAKLLTAFGLVGGGWTGLLRTLGLPVGIGLAASGGGHMTPEGYAGALKADPGRAKADAELNAQGGAGKRWWKRNMPTWLGGDAGGAGTGNAGVARSRGDPSGGRVTSGAGNAEGARESYTFWRLKGLSHEAAAGLVGMEEGESQFNPNARGDGGKAHGAFQHHPDRRQAIMRALGINISNATHQQQLEAAYWEFQGGDKKAAASWKAIQAAKTAGEAAAIGVYEFERPENKPGEAASRGQRANYWAKRFAGSAVVAPAPGRQPVTMNDILPGGLAGATNGGLPAFQMPTAPAPNINQSRSSSITINQAPITVSGMNDGKQVADRIDRVQGYRTSDLVRNMRSSVA
ncbi:phage tail tip lysozyme [Methylobacterium sp. J-068]|uniref:phage tail tip lysozyme n=1 Tax=Methylobacterium sp. J-068 TaxID=2836649 RepID=UPI001FBBBECF|nr:phage tail tip lysozyme [Methylobacterium sp. J-068]MCJ2036396.1 phage tail tip lysozyme [Methylobacterium sp. J-068]